MDSASHNLRNRRTQGSGQADSHVTPASSSNHRHGSTSNHGRISSLSWMSVLFLFYSMLILLHLIPYKSLPAVKSAHNAHPNEFSEERARIHLENIVKVGCRHAGSYENDVYAVNYILKTVAEIQGIADKSRNIEVDVQRPTGSFTLAFMDDFTSYYSNISNTVVRVTSPSSSDHALLLNCHTDSLINSPGASDDAAACAIMLEILRAVAVDNTPLVHTLILLFNGAEENILQASHGFITQHKWAKQVRAFINLEAAGAGGREFVFQTGPENPWLVWAWARNAPHPHGSSVGQDLFQSGLIPSDTDFRIYRDYGKIPGVDLAYILNGYVYHTYHDSIDKIQEGCIQRAGDNIISVVRHLVQSQDSLLADPSAYRHGGAAFFDFLGLFFVVVPLRLLTIINYFVILSVITYIGKRMMHPRVTGFSSFQYNSKLLKAIAVNILGYTTCIVSLASVAWFLTRTGHSMAWFSNPLLIIGLYLPAGLVGLVTVHWIAKKTIFKNDEPHKLESVFFDAVLIMWTSILFQSRNIGSSYMFLSYTLFAVIGRGLIARKTFDVASNAPSIKKIFIHLLIISVPTLLWLCKGWLVMDFFVPMTGRSGTSVPPDIIVFALFGIFLIATFSFLVPSLYLVDSLKWFYVIMTTCLTCSLIIAFSDVGFPYRGDPASPTLKRFFMQHINREFYNADGQMYESNSGMFMCHLDYVGREYHLGPEILMEDNDLVCKGSYCDMPFLLPVQKLVKKNQYLETPPPPASVTTDVYPFAVRWERTEVTDIEGSDPEIHHIKFKFFIDGPPHMALHITPIVSDSVNSTLEDWSFDGDIELAHSKESKAETYFVYYGGGHVHPVWEFWLQFAVEISEVAKNAPVLHLAVTAHYTPSGPVSKVNRQTPELEEITTQLHDWLAPMTWVSLYRKYTL